MIENVASAAATPDASSSNRRRLVSISTLDFVQVSLMDLLKRENASHAGERQRVSTTAVHCVNLFMFGIGYVSLSSLYVEVLL